MARILGYNSSMIDNGAAAIRNVLSNPSWFREHPHYWDWASASLPFAYAMACVEVVSKMSGKAGYSAG